MERHSYRAVALVDSVAGIVLVLLALAVVAPGAARLRNGCKMTRCAANLDAIGTSSKIYANDNNERWMVPPFSDSAYNPGNDGIDYLAGSWLNDIPIEPGEVGYDREFETTSDVSAEADGSDVVSTTRAYWMLVRSGDLRPDELVCPVSRDVVDDEYFPERYYDFFSYRNISYGYHVPYGPRDTQPREGANNRMVFAADKGPYYFDRFVPTFHTRRGVPVTSDSPQWRWRPYNSPNHRGRGQNVLYADGRVDFVDTPAVGIHGDNIYTLMIDDWDDTGFQRIHGESPHYATIGLNPFPGQGAFGPEWNAYSSTDSLIYP